MQEKDCSLTRQRAQPWPCARRWSISFHHNCQESPSLLRMYMCVFLSVSFRVKAQVLATTSKAPTPETHTWPTSYSSLPGSLSLISLPGSFVLTAPSAWNTLLKYLPSHSVTSFKRQENVIFSWGPLPSHPPSLLYFILFSACHSPINYRMYLSGYGLSLCCLHHWDLHEDRFLSVSFSAVSLVPRTVQWAPNKYLLSE